jgi:hypothetical protein
MPWEKRSHVLTSLVTALLSTTAPLSRALADGAIGAVSAVNQSANAVLSGGGTKTLTLGQDVLFKEAIHTTGAGSAQVAFIDRSTLNIGQNSTVVIDEFVFNPATGNGAMGLSISKGVMRFVGGQISHTTGIAVNTPVATVGLRGGSATIGIAGPKDKNGDCEGTIFVNHIGTLTLKNKVDQLSITRPGYGVCVVSDDLPFPPPFFIPDKLLQKYIRSATSQGDQHGGVNDLPTDQMASRAGFDFPRLGPPPDHPGGNPFNIVTIINSGNGDTTDQSQNHATPYPYY